jgi:hypothetical protein
MMQKLSAKDQLIERLAKRVEEVSLTAIQSPMKKGKTEATWFHWGAKLKRI